MCNFDTHGKIEAGMRSIMIEMNFQTININNKLLKFHIDSQRQAYFFKKRFEKTQAKKTQLLKKVQAKTPRTVEKVVTGISKNIKFFSILVRKQV